MKTLAQNKKDLSVAEIKEYWPDLFFREMYPDNYRNLNSKELDKSFNDDLKVLVRSLGRLPDPERKAFINILSSFIENYLENKVEKELDRSLYKTLKF